MNQIEFEKKLLGWLKNDRMAFSFCMHLVYISHLWDDLIDKDKPRTDEEINDAFRIALFEIPINPFFHNNSFIFLPLIQSAILQYEIANKIEKENDPNKNSAFYLRNGIMHIILTSIQITGGIKWVREIGAEFYQYLWEDFGKLFATFKEEIK